MLARDLDMHAMGVRTALAMTTSCVPTGRQRGGRGGWEVAGLLGSFQLSRAPSVGAAPGSGGRGPHIRAESCHLREIRA